MRGYRPDVIKRVKAHYEAEGYEVIEVRIEDGTVYIECEDKTYTENLDEWM